MARHTTSLTTTLRQINSMSVHLPESIQDLCAHAAAWDKLDGPAAQAPSVAAADVLNRLDQKSVSCTVLGSLVDIAVDPEGAAFLKDVRPHLLPERQRVIDRVLQQAEWLCDESKPFGEIPTMSQMMVELGAPSIDRRLAF